MQTNGNALSIWQAAIDRYYKEVDEGGIKGTPTIDRDLSEMESPNALIDEIQAIAPTKTKISQVWTTVLLKAGAFTDLTTFLAWWAVGVDGRAALLLWGSMRLSLKFASPVFPQLIVLLEELRTVLPQARLAEQEFPISDSLEAAFLDMYTETIIFYAYAIAFLRDNPNAYICRNPWSAFNSRFENTMSSLRVYSTKVCEMVCALRLAKATHSTENVETINSLPRLTIEDNPCRTNLFCGRKLEMDELNATLGPRNQDKNLKVMSVCGLAGVGKTQLALNYARTAGDSYDAIAWIQSDTQRKLVQGLYNFASKLGLSSEEGAVNYQAVQKVQDWLENSGKTFLLIFDNVEDLHVLNQIWAIISRSSNKGSIIITTRSTAVATTRTKKTMHLKSFQDGAAVGILYELTGMQPADENNQKAAQEICQLIGGHPLAMSHMSSFITDQGYSYEELLSIYKKHAERIFKDQPQMNYDCTLNTMWDLSLQSLSSNARVLLELLSFFDPDCIPESLLIGARAHITEPRVKFLKNDFDFGDAVSELVTKTSLIDRMATSKSLSLNRLVKSAVFVRIPDDERTSYLDVAVQLLYYGFPNTWDQRGPYQGHGWHYWETCSAIGAHWASLHKLQKQYRLKASNTEMFAELIFRIGTYRWEIEEPLEARTAVQYGLEFIDSNTRTYAQACRLLGGIRLDLAQPRAALRAYERALAARQKLEEPNTPAIAEVYDSIACSYSEIGDVSKALEFLRKADEINLAHSGRTSPRTQAIYSLAYLRGDLPEKSLEALHTCWKLQEKTQEEIAESKYPKHAGDIVLLARIQYALGQKEIGQQLALRALAIRRGIFGAKGPRVADSIFIVARMLAAAGELVFAAKMYEEIIEMSRNCTVEMQGHLARALWFLSSTEEQLKNPAAAERLRVESKAKRAEIREREAPDEDTDEAFMSLVGWMLW